jgi:hypothetical protein
MRRQTRRLLTWFGVALVAVIALLYYSESAMTWLRVTLHGR